MSSTLTYCELKKILVTLEKEQQVYINSFIVERKKSRYANLMAKEKGQLIPENATEADIRPILDGY